MNGDAPAPRARAAGPADPAALNAAEAARRLDRDGPNVLPGSAPRSLPHIAGGVVREPMLLAAGGIYLQLGSAAEAAFLLLAVAAVLATVLGQPWLRAVMGFAPLLWDALAAGVLVAAVAVWLMLPRLALGLHQG